MNNQKLLINTSNGDVVYCPYNGTLYKLNEMYDEKYSRIYYISIISPIPSITIDWQLGPCSSKEDANVLLNNYIKLLLNKSFK